MNWSQRPKSQQELDLFELSLEIEEKNAAEHGQLGFIATAMIYASLPHSDLETAVFKRKNGSISITIMNDPDIGLPFGKIPRIITAFLCTEAKQTASRTIQLGRSQAEFAKKLGLNTGGGKTWRHHPPEGPGHALVHFSNHAYRDAGLSIPLAQCGSHERRDATLAPA